MNKMLNYRKLVDIKASETTPLENPMWINVLNTGHWDTNYQGSFDVNTNDLDEMVVNFNDGVRKGVPIDTDHDNAGSNGWIEQLQVRNASELWALVEWTPSGFAKLENKEYKFLSPEFAPVYNDPETNIFRACNVLIAAALTNFPLMKGLQAIVAGENMKAKTLYFNEDPTKLKEKLMTKVTASEDESLEDQLDEIQDAFCAIDPNPLGMYGFSIVETHQDATGAGYLIVSSWGMGDELVYYRVAFKEDEATEQYTFEQPTKVEITFTTMKDEDLIMAKDKKVIASNKVRTVKAGDNTHLFEANALDAETKANALAAEVAAASTTDAAVVVADLTPVINASIDAKEGAKETIVAADPTHQFEVDAEAAEKDEPVVAPTPLFVKEADTVVAEPVVETPAVAVVEPVVAETPVVTPAVEVPVVETLVVEPVVTPVVDAPAEVIAPVTPEADTTKAGEFTLNPEILSKVGTPSKIKASDGTVKDVVEGHIVSDAPAPAPTIVAVEGSATTITAAEYAELISAKEESIKARAEIAKRDATEKIETLVFSEKSFRMPVESKDNVVEFYLALNEKQRDDFTKILEKLPSAKLFNEVGDAGTVASGASAYEDLGTKAEAIMKANEGKKMNYGQALSLARRENPELAKLANEHRATTNVNKGK